MSLQPGEKKQPLSNQSTEKALAILELLAQSSEPVRLRDLSRTLSINASTALRFLTTLQNCGYVEQEADTQRYYLTYKICRLATRSAATPGCNPLPIPISSGCRNSLKRCCVSRWNGI